MPSPNRESSKIAYTRWEPLEASTPEDVEATSNHNNNNAGDVLPFHHFEQELQIESSFWIKLHSVVGPTIICFKGCFEII